MEKERTSDLVFVPTEVSLTANHVVNFPVQCDVRSRPLYDLVLKNTPYAGDEDDRSGDCVT
jgi:hypothetical protein